MLKTWWDKLFHGNRQTAPQSPETQEKPEVQAKPEAPAQPEPATPRQQEAARRAAQDQCRVYVEKSMAFLLQEMLKEREKPFRGTGVRFPIAGKGQEVLMTLDMQDGPQNVRLILGVHENDDDHVVSHYLFKGTRQDIEVYLKDPKNVDEWMTSLHTLSERVDEGFD